MKQLLLKEAFTAVDQVNHTKLSALLKSNIELFTAKDDITGDTLLHYVTRRLDLPGVNCILKTASECPTTDPVDLQLSILTITNHANLSAVDLLNSFQSSTNNDVTALKKALLYRSILNQIMTGEVKLPDASPHRAKTIALLNLLDIQDEHGNLIAHHVVQHCDFLSDWILQQQPQALFHYNKNNQTPLALVIQQNNKNFLLNCLNKFLVDIQIPEPEVDTTSKFFLEKQRIEEELTVVKIQAKLINQNSHFIKENVISTLGTTVLKGKYTDELLALFSNQADADDKVIALKNKLNTPYPFPPRENIPAYTQIQSSLEQQLLEINHKIKEHIEQSKKDRKETFFHNLLDTFVNIHQSNNNNIQLQSSTLTAKLLLADIRIIKLLILAGVPYNATDEKGKKLSTYLVEHKLATSEVAATMLLASWAAPSVLKNVVDLTDEQNNTFLHVLIKQEQHQQLKALVDSNMPLPALKQNVDRLTALQYARQLQQPTSFRLLIAPTLKAYYLKDYNMSTNFDAFNQKMNNISDVIWYFSGWEKNTTRWPSFDIKLNERLIEVIKQVLAIIGLDVKQVRDANGNSMLHWASAMQQDLFAFWLLQQSIRPLEQNKLGQTAVHMAILQSFYPNNPLLERLEKSRWIEPRPPVVRPVDSYKYKNHHAFEAIENVDIEKLEQCYASCKIDIDAQQNEMSLLYTALKKVDKVWEESSSEERKLNTLIILISILEHGAIVLSEKDVEKVTKNKNLQQLLALYRIRYALMEASIQGDFKKLKNNDDNYIKTLKAFNLANAQSKELQYLKNHIDKKLTSNLIQDIQGNTPLHYLVQYCVKSKQIEAITPYQACIQYWLYVRPSDLYVNNGRQKKPFDVVVDNKSHSLYEALYIQLRHQNIIAAIKHGDLATLQMIWAQLPKEIIASYSKGLLTYAGTTLLYYAFLHGHYDIAEWLFRVAKCVNIVSRMQQGPYAGKTIFSIAKNGGSHFVSLLLHERNKLILEELDNKEQDKLVALLKADDELDKQPVNHYSPYEILDLRGHRLSEKQLVNLLKALLKDTHIKVLRINWNSPLLEQTMTLFGEVFHQNKTLEEIDISGNQLTPGNLTILLANWKLNPDSKLSTLHLKHCDLTRQSVETIYDVVKSNPHHRLRTISLEGNSEISWPLRENLAKELRPDNPLDTKDEFIFPLTLPDEFDDFVNQLRKSLLSHPLYQVLLKQTHNMQTFVPVTKEDAVLWLLHTLRYLLDVCEKQYNELKEDKAWDVNQAIAYGKRWRDMVANSPTGPRSATKREQLAKYEALYTVSTQLEQLFSSSATCLQHQLINEQWLWQFYARIRQTQTRWLMLVNQHRDTQYKVLLKDKHEYPHTLSIFEKNFKRWLKILWHGYEQWLENSIHSPNTQMSTSQFFEQLVTTGNSNLFLAMFTKMDAFKTIDISHHKMRELVQKLQSNIASNQFYQALGNSLMLLSEHKAFNLLAKTVAEAYCYQLSLLPTELTNSDTTAIQQQALYMACHVGYWLATENVDFDTPEAMNQTLGSLFAWLRFVPWIHDTTIETRAGKRVTASKLIQLSAWLCKDVTDKSHVYNVGYEQNNKQVYTDGLSFGSSLVIDEEVACLQQVVQPESVKHKPASVAGLVVSKKSAQENIDSETLDPSGFVLDMMIPLLDNSITTQLARKVAQKAESDIRNQLQIANEKIAQLELNSNNEKTSSNKTFSDLEKQLKTEQENHTQQLDDAKKEIKRLEKLIEAQKHAYKEEVKKQQDEFNKLAEKLNKQTEKLNKQTEEFSEQTKELDALKTKYTELQEEQKKFTDHAQNQKDTQSGLVTTNSNLKALEERFAKFQKDVENKLRKRDIENDTPIATIASQIKDVDIISSYNNYVLDGHHPLFNAPPPEPVNNNNQTNPNNPEEEQNENEQQGFCVINVTPKFGNDNAQQ